ncbi:MAG: hypothetical protein Q7T56_12640 [Nocardioidaceae bacterium]|nr:hypothetical protein [Nocardioidaceae bacterium]
MNRTARRTAVHLSLLVGLVATAGTTSPASAADHADERAATSSYVFAPGRVGPATAGMSRRAALRTGLFVADLRAEPCPVQPLAWKGKKRRGQLFVDTTRSGRIVEMYALRGRFTTTRGVGIGSTYRAVRHAYGARLGAPRPTANGVVAVDVRRGSGAGTRWLTFGFPETTGATLVASDRVANLTVRRGTRPQLVSDGC